MSERRKTAEDNAREALGDPTLDWHTQFGIYLDVTYAEQEKADGQYRERMQAALWHLHEADKAYRAAADDDEHDAARQRLLDSLGMAIDDLISLRGAIAERPFVRSET